VKCAAQARLALQGAQKKFPKPMLAQPSRFGLGDYTFTFVRMSNAQGFGPQTA
jgi:hypothetical protein